MEKPILWNHTYLCGPMFVDCQNYAGSFVGNWFEALQCKTIHNFVKHSWRRKFMCKGDQQNPQTSTLH